MGKIYNGLALRMFTLFQIQIIYTVQFLFSIRWVAGSEGISLKCTHRKLAPV
jgi:hypothetical protein